MKVLVRAFLLCFLLSGLSLADQSSPYSTVENFYAWYQNAGMDYRDKFEASKPYLSKELYGLLHKGFQRNPDDGFWVDFDPFVNAQMDARKVSVGKPYTVSADMAMVKVTPIFGRGSSSSFEGPAIKVYVRQVGSTWKIANFVYTGDHPFQLKTYLQDGLGQGGGESADTMLSPEEAVAEKLLGTWHHQSTSKTADGAAEPLTGVKISWTFQPGGKGHYSQQVGGGSANRLDFNWTLENQTITLGGATKYTVVKNSGNTMIWKNHRLGDFYHVVKQ